jgi:hypothetical protein
LYVLLHGPDADGSEVFKLALHELVGRAVLALAILQQGSGSTTTRTAVLVPGLVRPAELGRALGSVMDVYDSLPAQTPGGARTGVTVQDLSRGLRERHDGTLGQWVKDDVVAALVERGLYTQEEGKRLVVFSTTRREPTPEGKAARALLEAAVKRAEDEFPSWAADDRPRAGAFLAVAGSGVLLIPELWPAIERLHAASPGARKLMAAGGETVGSSADRDFDVFRLVAAGAGLKTLDLNIDYGQLDRDRTNTGG